MTDFREFQDGEMVPGTRYRVTRLIGAGGMGRVYEVEHVELGKRFVLKALQRELARREDLVARLRNEWRALARLQHPNIVNVTDAGTSENGVPFYVMERLEGETLSTLLHRARRLLPQQALAIAAGILDGLHAAHQIGVVHRDVKPPNIFLIGPTTVKVLDFGIAKIQDASNVITARGMAVGTPRYMSPEQANGTPVDARSDVYATGLMLFEMVSGVGPFDDARDNNELLLAQLGRKAPLLSSISVVAPELDALVAGMLAKDPRERPRDAHQVAEALRNLAQRYERSVATDAPTRSAVPAQSAVAEPPTRVDGPRRASQSEAPPTRPDGVAAGRPALRDETTTLQPRLEIATTAVPQSSRGGTQRMPEVPLPPATLYGSDTLVDRTTSAPTAVPGPAPERTETLLVVPPPLGGSPVPDPGETRTSVPLAEAPNLTPPPVVPGPSTRSPQGSRGRRGIRIAVTALLSLGVLLVVMALRTSGSVSPDPGRQPASAPAPESMSVEPPRIVTVPLAPLPTASPVPAASVVTVPRPSSSRAPALPLPPIYELVTNQNQNKKSDVLGPVPAPKTAPAAAPAPRPTPKSPPAMPGSGL